MATPTRLWVALQTRKSARAGVANVTAPIAAAKARIVTVQVRRILATPANRMFEPFAPDLICAPFSEKHASLSTRQRLMTAVARHCARCRKMEQSRHHHSGDR